MKLAVSFEYYDWASSTWREVVRDEADRNEPPGTRHYARNAQRKEVDTLKPKKTGPKPKRKDFEDDPD